MLSTFRIWGKGRVVENLPFGASEITFIPYEHQPMNAGEETSRVDQLKFTGEDQSGRAYAAKANTSGALRAKWLPMGSNRVTAPNVCRGERVTIWATGDHGEFRWTIDGDDAHLRNTEIVIFAFAATKDFSSKPDLRESMYVFEVNTETGHAVVHTSAARGEACTMTLSLNGRDGVFQFIDGMQNTIKSDGPASRVTIGNRYGAEVGIHEDRVWLRGMRATLDVKAADVLGDMNVQGVCTAATFRQPAPKSKKPYD